MSAHYLTHQLRDSYIGVLLVGMLLGLLFPNVFGPLQPYSAWWLQVIFFLTSLRIDFRGVWQELRAWTTVLWVSCFMLILLPLVTYSLVEPIFPVMALPLVLLAAMPVGMTSPLLAQLFGLNVSLALVLTLATSLLAPLTVPLVIGILFGAGSSIDLNSLFLTLVTVIIVPFGLAQIIRRLFPRGVTNVYRFHKPISLFFIGILIAGIAGKYQPALLQRFTGEYALGLVAMMLFFLLVHVAGYWLTWWRDRHDRLTVTLCVVYMNFTLAIFIAEKFFGTPDVIFYTILSILPWNIGIILFRRVVG